MTDATPHESVPLPAGTARSYFRLVTAEALATFTALQRQGVESELLFLPDENHHCLNPQNSLVWHHAVLSWIKKHTA